MDMQNLLAVVAQLRDQCEWNKKQTSEGLTQYAIEEAYEVEHAVRVGDSTDVCTELGDLLFQVVLQAQIYQEQGQFDFDDVVQGLTEKLQHRHPHVFSQQNMEEDWQTIKSKEKPKRQLSQVKHAPALIQAEEIQKNVASVGFDFENLADATDKFHEEWQELHEAIEQNHIKEIQAEFGDCLFSLINIGRKLGVSSEQALLDTIYKFRTRFFYIETHATKPIDTLSLQEMNTLWEQAKKQ